MPQQIQFVCRVHRSHLRASSKVNKPLRFQQLAKAKRDPSRLDLQARVRTEHPHLRIIDTPQKRFELEMWIQAEHCVVLKGWLIDMTYDNPQFFKTYAFESGDTIFRDCRYLEEGDPSVGLEPMFEKPAKAKVLLVEEKTIV